MGLVRPCWAGLSAAERAAAAALGWSGAEAWDGGGMPAAAELLWAELAQAQRDAATALGFSGPGWDGEEETFEGMGLKEELCRGAPACSRL